MKIKKVYFKEAAKFLEKNRIEKEEIDELIVKGIKKVLFKEQINVDIKKLKGQYKQYYRIRKSDIRILFYIMNNIDEIEVNITEINYRGDAY